MASAGTTAAGVKYRFNLTRPQLKTLEITRREGRRAKLTWGHADILPLCVHVLYFFYFQAGGRLTWLRGWAVTYEPRRLGRVRIEAKLCCLLGRANHDLNHELRCHSGTVSRDHALTVTKCGYYNFAFFLLLLLLFSYREQSVNKTSEINLVMCGKSNSGSLELHTAIDLVLSLYLGARGILDGGVGALWGPGDALHHVLVLPQLSLALFGSHHPHAHRLVVGAAGQQRAVLVGPHHPDPLPVAGEGFYAVANCKEKEKSVG